MSYNSNGFGFQDMEDFQDSLRLFVEENEAPLEDLPNLLIPKQETSFELKPETPFGTDTRSSYMKEIGEADTHIHEYSERSRKRGRPDDESSNEEYDDEDHHSAKQKTSTPKRGRPSANKNAAPGKSVKRTVKSSCKANKAGSTSKGKSASSKSGAEFSELFNNNPYEAAKRVEGLPDAPEFGASNKRADALKQLMLDVKAKGLPTDFTAADFNRACQAFSGPHTKIKPVETKWDVQGMQRSSALFQHQLFGSAFLRRREKAGEVPRGGILADAMGFGSKLFVFAG